MEFLEKHECSECKKTFTEKGNLNRHKLIHSGVKPHGFKDCATEFTLKQHLDQHVKAVHMGERPHECSVCKKTLVIFKYKSVGISRKHLSAT